MNILEKIVRAKRREIDILKKTIPVKVLEKSEYFQAGTHSLENSLREKDGYGIIAEFKRQSPSRGVINSLALPEEVCVQYINSGAAAVSILTNRQFFGGMNEDVEKVRKLIDGPVLRKEFIIDEYQVVESKSMGADAILLIADILTAGEMNFLSSLAFSMNLEVLFEIHDPDGIRKLPPSARLVGVNSRNLGNFSINMDILKTTISRIPGNTVKIAESGIDSAEALMDLKNEGFRGFLIGEMFMREPDPGRACNEFLKKLNER